MRLGSSIVVVLSFLLLPLVARAEDACRVDVETLCKDVPPGGGRIMACLKAHESDLSPACKEKLAAGEAKREMVKEACQSDAEKFCKGIRPGEGRIAACLKAHESELTPACQKLVERVETAIREVHEACGGDVEKLCQGIRPGGGRILACLKSHEAELSGPCKAVLARKEKPAK
ncbi:MAG: cysteine rich repeat-containing protein [Polyangia bacterium]